MQYVVRQASKAAGLWNSAPLHDEITPIVMQKFQDVVHYYKC